MELKKQISYVRGLVEGLGLDDSNPERKVVAALVDVIGALEAKVEELEERLTNTEDTVEMMDESLDDVFDILAGDDEDDEHECGCGGHGHGDGHGCGHHHDGEHECGCGGRGHGEGCGHHHDDGEEHECCCGHHHDDDDEDLGLVLNCPVCGEKIEITDEMWHSHVFKCPHCGDKLELDFGDGGEEEHDHE